MTKSIGADFIALRTNLGATWNEYTAASKFLVIFFAILSLPFLIESAVWIAAIIVLVPICFIFGVIKHRVPILWIIIIFFINLGGLADLAADVWLIGKLIVIRITGDIGHFDNDTEKYLFLARFIVTLVTGVPGIFIFYTTMGVETKTEQAARVQKGQKTSNSGGGGAITALLMIGLWKVVVGVARIMLLVKIIVAAVKHKKITSQVEYSIQYLEAFLSIDVLCAAIPLGILTALEMFYFSHHNGFAPGEVYELVKLVSLAIDLVGLAYLFYFEIFGLDRCTGGHPDEPKLEETTPIINSNDADAKTEVHV